MRENRTNEGGSIHDYRLIVVTDPNIWGEFLNQTTIGWIQHLHTHISVKVQNPRIAPKTAFEFCSLAVSMLQTCWFVRVGWSTASR